MQNDDGIFFVVKKSQEAKNIFQNKVVILLFSFCFVYFLIKEGRLKFFFGDYGSK